MRKNKKQRRIMLLLILILSITIGFALLSTTLKINGNASIKSNTWDIHWDDSSINVTQGSVEASDPVVSGEDSDTVSFNVEFSLPGDFYEFEIDAVNEGSIDGAINTVSTLIYDSSDLEHPLTGDDIPEYLLYSVKYSDGTTPADGDILAHGDSRTYKIRLEFDEDWETFPEEEEEYVVKVEIPYIQHKTSSNNDTPQQIGDIPRNSVFAYPTTSVNWGDSGDTLENYTNDYTTLKDGNDTQRNVFLALQLSGEKVESVSVCGIRSTNGKVFCLQPSTTSETFQSQRAFLVEEFGDANDNGIGCNTDSSDSTICYNNEYQKVLSGSLDFESVCNNDYTQCPRFIDLLFVQDYANGSVGIGERNPNGPFKAMCNISTTNHTASCN